MDQIDNNPLSLIISFLKEKHEIETAHHLLTTFIKYSHSLEQFDNLGKNFFEIKDYDKAIEFTEKTLVLAPNNEVLYSARMNLAKVYNHVNRPDKALFYLKQNETITPNDADLKLELAFTLFLLNRKNEAETILRSLLNDTSQPESVIDRVKFNLGTYDLFAGKFQQGMKGFLLSGKKLNIWKKLTLPLTFWEGGVYPGKDIIIVGEGGIGDEVINVRFMKHFEDVGMNPIWYTSNKELAALFNRNGFVTITSLDSIKKDSLWTYGMSSPHYLDLTENDLWYGQYLFSLNSSIDINTDRKLKIGLRWGGNPYYDHDLHRKVPIKQLYETIKNDDCYEFYCLQRDTDLEDLNTFDHDIKTIPLDTFEELLSSLSSLDLIITSCTSIAHFAAALNKKVFVLVPISSYYVWNTCDEYKTPWYSQNVTIFRQKQFNSWKQPIDDVCNHLNDLKSMFTVPQVFQNCTCLSTVPNLNVL